jgi:hypothetical protein
MDAENLSEYKFKPLSKTALIKIFGEVLDREQILAITRGTKPKGKPRVVARMPGERPRCLICGQQINARNCRPFRQPSIQLQATIDQVKKELEAQR